METSSCTTDLLCFHSSNRPCAIPKSVSGSGVGKIFWALFEIHHKTIIWCLSIFSGVYLVNGRRCRCCISFVGNFRCTFIQRVRLRLCTNQCDPPPHPPSRDITGHLRGIFCYLTSERAAGIGDFDLFCTSSKNSGGVDQGIFHRGGLGRESLIRHLLTLNPLLLAHWI